MRQFLLMLAVLAAAEHANADSGVWSVSAEPNPFTRGQRVVAEYQGADGVEVELLCEQSDGGFTVKVRPGDAYEEKIAQRALSMDFAVDGRMVYSERASAQRYRGDILEVQIELTSLTGGFIADALAQAEHQVAIQITYWFGDRQYLLDARGVQLAGSYISQCMKGEFVAPL